jgi:hypothetical protein
LVAQEIEDVGGKTAPDPDRAENLWCAYAWPYKRHDGRGRVFFVDQSGIVLGSQNDASGQRYEGDNGPRPWAAFPGRSAGNKTRSRAENELGTDGGVWTVIPD